MVDNLILISAYINIESKEQDSTRAQTFPFYQERGQKLINVDVPKIIFIDVNYITEFQENDSTILIPISLNELDIYQYYQRILDSSNGITCLSPNQIKDTVLYHIIQIAKTEFVSRAINYFIHINNINNHSRWNNIDIENCIYGWIDFGIRKMFQSDNIFQTTIIELPSRIKELQTRGNWQSNKLKIPGCWNLNSADNTEFNMIRWYFCGSFFLGTKEVLLEFEKEVKKELETILAIQKRIIFEVNIWFRIWKRRGVDMDWYLADHNASMLQI